MVMELELGGLVICVLDKKLGKIRLLEYRNDDLGFWWGGPKTYEE